MNIGQIDHAVILAVAFVEAAAKAKRRINAEYKQITPATREGHLLCLITGSKETAACKRASMDLSRALTELRR